MPGKRIAAAAVAVSAWALLCASPGEAQTNALPTAAPWRDDLVVGRPPVEPAPYGYGTLDVDRDELLGLLRARRFEALETVLVGHRDRVRADIRQESRLLIASGAFHGTERDVGPLVDAWIERMPSSSMAHVARAQFLLARWREVWGDDAYGELDAGRRAAMRTHLERAVGEGEEAVALDPENFAAHAVLLSAVTAYGWSEAAQATVADALARFPASYVLRQMALQAMGGRVEERARDMQRVVKEAQRYAADNPRLRALAAALPRARAARFIGEQRWSEALAELDRAQEIDDGWEVHYARGRIWYFTHDWVRALDELNRVVAVYPTNPEALAWRGGALGQIATRLAPAERRGEVFASAAADLEYAIRFTIPEGWTREWYAWSVTKGSACAEAPKTCLGRIPAGVIEALFDDDGGPRGWLTKLVYFVLSIPVTLYLVLGESNELGLGPTPLVAFLILGWSFIEWARQRFWTPPLVHVMAGLAFLMILGLNAAWISVGGGMWTQRFVMIAICVMVPYVVYLLFLGPRFLGRRRKR